MKIRLFTIPFLLLVLGTSFVDAGSSVVITESEFGERWPFTISRGTLSCTPFGKHGIVTFTANGKTYAVNGLAKGRAKQNGWREIDEIWKANPSFPGTKTDMHPIIEKGLSLCAGAVLAEEYTPPKLDGDPIQVVKKLYLDLLSFKGKADFHRLGFGEGSPYNKWLKSVESISYKKEFVEAFLQLGGEILPGNLPQLGREYIFSRGKETDYSKFLREKFDKALKVKKE